MIPDGACILASLAQASATSKAWSGVHDGSFGRGAAGTMHRGGCNGGVAIRSRTGIRLTDFRTNSALAEQRRFSWGNRFPLAFAKVAEWQALTPEGVVFQPLALRHTSPARYRYCAKISAVVPAALRAGYRHAGRRPALRPELVILSPTRDQRQKCRADRALGQIGGDG